MNRRNNGPRFSLSSGDRVIQNGGRAGRTIQYQASQGVQGFRGTRFSSGRNIYPTSVHNRYLSGSVSPSVGHFEYQDFRYIMFVLRLLPARVSADPIVFIV